MLQSKTHHCVDCFDIDEGKRNNKLCIKKIIDVLLNQVIMKRIHS